MKPSPSSYPMAAPIYSFVTCLSTLFLTSLRVIAPLLSCLFLSSVMALKTIDFFSFLISAGTPMDLLMMASAYFSSWLISILDILWMMIP